MNVAILDGPKQPVDIQIGNSLWMVYDFPRIKVDGLIDFRLPRWFPTDYASFSVGIAYHFFQPRDDSYDVPAGAHDYLVRNRKTLGIGLRDCHDVFYALLKLYGCPTVPAWTMYSAVRAFNWMCLGDGYGKFRHNWKAAELDRYYRVRHAFDIGDPVIDYSGERVMLMRAKP